MLLHVQVLIVALVFQSALSAPIPTDENLHPAAESPEHEISPPSETPKPRTKVRRRLRNHFKMITGDPEGFPIDTDEDRHDDVNSNPNRREALLSSSQDTPMVSAAEARQLSRLRLGGVTSDDGVTSRQLLRSGNGGPTKLEMAGFFYYPGKRKRPRWQ